MPMSLSDDLISKRFSDFARHSEKQDAHMEALLGRIRERLPRIEELLVEIADDWGEEWRLPVLSSVLQGVWASANH
jgi:hypothetical protein